MQRKLSKLSLLLLFLLNAKAEMKLQSEIYRHIQYLLLIDSN